MSAPSAQHQERVQMLDTIAVLAGFTRVVRLRWGERPDVVRIDVLHSRLFVGDAKHTEVAGRQATLQRLAGYIDEIAEWCRAGFSAWLVLCTPEEWRSRWEAALGSICQRAGLRAVSIERYQLGEDAAVVGMRFQSVEPLAGLER